MTIVTEPKRPRGRPRKADKLNTVIEIRLTQDELDTWKHRAMLAGLSLSEWVRKNCRMTWR
jgi:hypothetical protein